MPALRGLFLFVMKPKILLQIDHDENPSTFDSIVGIDSGVDHLLRYGGVTPIEIESIVHGAIFTRGPKDLHQTALFFGGTNVQRAEELFEQAKSCFFGPLKVSMMSDPNGSNTTAVAAVLSASKHQPLRDSQVTVLAGTGPVGMRVCQLLAANGARVNICSRVLGRAKAVCDKLSAEFPDARVRPVEVAVPDEAVEHTDESDIVFAAGAAGVELLGDSWTNLNNNVKVVVDVNAVPPAGIRGVEVTDQAENRHSKICYGAVGVGGLKMKIHKQAVRQLFESNDQILSTSEIFTIGQALLAG